ncbi:universal stress protein [Actinocorallia longicatena]|uniref:UspA domain-containing protein n=1 Tax=Actinocorallia longicatena TaxID=111803 RepID=A0ABP6QDC6_9ACTN
MRLTTDPRRVVVGVDGSPNSYAALARAAREAERRRARLEVYLASPAAANPVGRFAAWLRLRGSVAERLPAAQHVTTRLHVVSGDPVTVLVEAARNAELLVVGAGSCSGSGGPLSGAVVPRLVSGAPCEIVICSGRAVSGDRG